MALFESFGYEVINAQEEYSAGKFFNREMLGRETPDQVVLLSRLTPALQRLNPELPAAAIDLAQKILVQDRSLKDLAVANYEIYKLLKDRVKIDFKDEDSNDVIETVRLVDWENRAITTGWLFSNSGCSTAVVITGGDLTLYCL